MPWSSLSSAPIHRRAGLRGSQSAQALALFGLLIFIPGISENISSIARVVRQNLEERLAPLLSLSAPHLGERVLPLHVQELLRIAQKHQLKDFSLSEPIANNALLLQRVTEGGWPMQLENGSKHRFIGIDEPLPSDCQFQESMSLVVYVVCG